MFRDIEAELKHCMGPEASFRRGQREAIEEVLKGKRVLVVQKTGWGKSLIYFLAAKILREQRKGIAVIISPLLALMHNQLESARRWGLTAETINSGNTDDWPSIKGKIFRDQLDILFVAPERLGNEEFKKNILPYLEIGMFVVDEAHCISDWGHDFRPDYIRILNLVKYLPPNVPLLATTATANDRVVEDIKEQFGGNVMILRGPLARESLHIQILKLSSIEERMAWLARYLPNLPGTGIIYCLTTKDCDNVSRWLRYKGIKAEAYYSAGKSAEDRNELEKMFYNNEVKVLVATVALGMGIDKPDIGFVIHFQRPGNIIAYYQQIGRAGRDGADAYAILMIGAEDERIHDYFIRTAFPTESEMKPVIDELSNSDGLTKKELLGRLNITNGKIENALKFLTINGDIFKDGSKYFKTPKAWDPDFTHADELTAMRRQELSQMNDYCGLDTCYMEYITKALNDVYSKPCGKCGNCKPDACISSEVPVELITEVGNFLDNEVLKIEPRKLWGDGTRIRENEKLSDGIVLSNYAFGKWGKLVQNDKYNVGKFSDELVDASCKRLRGFCRVWGIDLVVPVTSLNRPRLVPDFAARLAGQLDLDFCQAIEKIKETPEQKLQNNSAFQSKNIIDAFSVKNDYAVKCKLAGKNVLLVDDMVDSRWTLTVLASDLVLAGANKVFAFVLSNTGVRS